MRKLLLSAAMLSLFGGTAFADEGIWTFDNFPSAAVKAKYGATVDQLWLDRVRGSVARLSSGCSSSIVSANGLVLTNHHCVANCAQDLSTAERDYLAAGFSAAKREDERTCPGLQADVLEAITDVTAKIAPATAGKMGQDFVRSRDAVIAGIEKAACMGREATHRCQVISLYEGGQYKLYTYRKYSDVRLVFAVEEATAFFGGDPDNFNFPRYDLDFSFLRLYENGKPVATPNHLAWSSASPKDGEPVFVAGNPGGTDRLLTADDLAFERDVLLPDRLMLNSEIRGRYTRFSEESAEHARIVNRDLFGVENTLKAMRGAFQALTEPALFAAKRKADADLKAKVLADAKLKTDIGDPWAEIARAQSARAALNTPYYFLEGQAGWGSRLYGYARRLVRAAAERAKPNGERLPEYADARLALLEKQLLDAQPVEHDTEQLKLEFWLTKLREFLTADAKETALYLAKDSPENLSKTLAASKLGDPALRKQLWTGGMAAINASTDPMIKFVLKTDAAARAVRKSYEAQVQGPSDRAYERIAKARFAVYGTSVYPDATFSLRLSYGKVTGWTEKGARVPPFTTFFGLFTRATGQPPFDLAPRWVNAQAKVNPATVFNISSDNDIIGGNSGSPLINAKGEVVGAIFDGNIHSLGGDYAFDPALNRTVSVATSAITEALNKVYMQPALVAELMAK